MEEPVVELPVEAVSDKVIEKVDEVVKEVEEPVVESPVEVVEKSRGHSRQYPKTCRKSW